MFGFGRRKDDAVVEGVCERLRALIGILEHRLGGMSPELTRDPFVIGYIVNMAVIFAMIETNGRASTTLRGHVSLAGLQTAFASLHMSMQEASAAMHLMVGNLEAKRGADAADLVLGVGAGKTDRDSDPRVIQARAALAAMPADICAMLGSNERSNLLHVLQDNLLFTPLEAKYGSRLLDSRDKQGAPDRQANP
ncbi:MAG: hypothetical protein ACJ8HI_13815 [Massilia sp.]